MLLQNVPADSHLARARIRRICERGLTISKGRVTPLCGLPNSCLARVRIGLHGALRWPDATLTSYAVSVPRAVACGEDTTDCVS
jgi:hypothetical protein